MKQFKFVKTNRAKKSAFNLSHEKKLTAEMGTLTPVMLQEVIPGDRFQVRSEHLLRFMPMITPIMHRVNVFTHFWFVPNRLVWDAWEEFITGGKDGQAAPNFPKIIGNNNQAKTEMGLGSLADYLGVPSGNYTTSSQNISPVSQLPFRGYQLIFNEFYRDQNLRDEIVIDKGSSNISLASPTNILSLRKRAWEKDYFTSALPWAQRGPEVNLPISGTLPVSGIPVLTDFYDDVLPDGPLENVDGTIEVRETGAKINALEAELTGVNASITDVRRMFAVQRWYEKNARFGGRYAEQLLSHFGITKQDARLQRPEYLGGGKIPVQVSEILQTSSSDETSPQGNMSGHGITAGVAGFDRNFYEHGYIFGIMTIMPRTAYYQGLPKHLTKFDRFDYFWSDFAHIGEQPVKKGELYHDENPEKNEETFGFQERYVEYRTGFDSVHGDFRDSLEFWHMGRKFDAQPSLNASFVECTPTDRIWSVEPSTYKPILVNVYHDVKAIRQVPKHGTPV